MTWFLDKAFLAGLDLHAYDAAAIATRVGAAPDAVAAFVDPRRTLWVQSGPEYGWLAGADRQHRPTLLFVGAPRLDSATVQPLNAVTFDRGAMTIETAAIALSGPLEWEGVLAAAAAAIGFIHVGNAPIFPFKHPTIWHYAAVPFPFHLHDDALGRGEGDPELVRRWIERGNYVLHCGDAFYLGEGGEVESS
ncbi:hypothetical protein [Nannocystis punicea]|uniref:Uncharacterized protein n=1 Tax=Nannocystis punicea TaxID=2995304 RepID=A0ABY7HAJ4_9BACT|nr:hypothetical protein [Nannocystis poenicansa]WAS96115.1 hypothetical protein O0S08_08115 [Nannocystis poenicansa]